MKRLLVVSRMFPPCSMIGTHRPLKLVRGIREFGWEPYVLTAADNCQRPSDRQLGRDVLAKTVVRRVPCWSPWWHLDEMAVSKMASGRVARLAGRALVRATEALLPGGADYPWVLAATALGVSMVRRYGIDLIWVTAPPWAALYLARAIAERTGVPYVADFRDVIKGSASGWRLGKHQRDTQHVRAVVRGAAGVTYAAPAQEALLRNLCPEFDSLPHQLVYNWFERWDVSSTPVQFQQPTIFHGGILYAGTRRVDGLLKAVSLLRARSHAAGRIQFIQHGMEQDKSHLVRDAEAFGVTDAVHIGGTLPFAEFQRICRGADILLLAVAHDTAVHQHSGAIPGKLYDYMAACRPVLVLGPEGCEAGRIVSRANRGIAVRDDDPQKIAEAIELLLKGEGVAGPLDLSLQAVGEYETTGALSRLANLFTSVADAPRSMAMSSTFLRPVRIGTCQDLRRKVASENTSSTGAYSNSARQTVVR